MPHSVPCEFDDYDHPAEEELFPTFSNTMSLNHTTDMFNLQLSSALWQMEREGYTIEGDYLQAKHVSVVQLSDVQHNRAIRPVVIAGNPPIPQRQSSNDIKAFVAGTNNAALFSSSTHNMWMNAEGDGSSVPSLSCPITDVINSLIHTLDASHSVSIGQDLSMQQ
ncbi:hypothetical protein Tco_1197486 [Tanacetum coccineum]